MVQIIIDSLSNNCSVQMEGHADYAEHGRDIVCSAISILTYTFANMLAINGAKELKVDLDGEIRTISFLNDRSDKISTILDSFVMGLRLLEASYPEHVKID